MTEKDGWFKMTQLEQKLHQRECAVSKDGIPFFIKQINRHRMIRTNKSHNLRAQRG